ncbi:MAG TPA: nucleotidyltransferase domain-containing protein [Balneolaceae bacterium]|nr:nucleotidyltransferase domain-containing protein [Balneolaceae bacterium]
MLTQKEIDKLKALFSTYSEVEAVYLFGSAAAGNRNKMSDIDLGIVYNDDSITQKKVDLYAELVKKGFEKADIVFFNSADLVLQFEIIHHNQLIYSKKGFKHGKLFSKTIRKYFDFEPYLIRQQKAYKKRALNDED